MTQSKRLPRNLGLTAVTVYSPAGPRSSNSQLPTSKCTLLYNLIDHRYILSSIHPQLCLNSVQVQSQRPAISLPHQQVRQLQPQLPPPSTSLRSSAASSSAQTRPKNQIEAMPPMFAPLPTPLTPPRSPVYDPLTCHPVFFTQSLRKPPFTVPDTGGGWLNPVATGYIVEQKKGLALRGKL